MSTFCVALTQFRSTGLVRSLLGVLAKVRHSLIAAPQLRGGTWRVHQRDGNFIIYTFLEEWKKFLVGDLSNSHL